MVSQLSSPTNYSSGFVAQSVSHSSGHPRARGFNFKATILNGQHNSADFGAGGKLSVCVHVVVIRYHG